MNIRAAAPRVPHITLLALLVLAVFLGGYALGVSRAPGPTSAPAALTQADDGEAFWGRLRTEGYEVTRFSTLAEMVAASDVVVVAKVSDVKMSRTIQGDSVGDTVAYASVVLRVERILAGSAPASIPVEFLIGATAEKAQPELELLQKAIPTTSSVYFLHAKLGEGEKGLYRLSNSTGLWAATTRAELDAPLQESAPRDSRLYGKELDGVSSIAGLAELVTSYVSK